MGSATVFPGGALDPPESAQQAAARELFEEAGILMARDVNGQQVSADVAANIRAAMNAGTSINELLLINQLRWNLDGLHFWARWITPSAEPKRFAAEFFVAELPVGQVATCDQAETVEQHWLTCAQALANAGDLCLPPPQIRTLYEMSNITTFAELTSIARRRQQHAATILPRQGQDSRGFCLLMPWDPDYVTVGQGESAAMSNPPWWAIGPSRFVKTTAGWLYEHAQNANNDASKEAV
jgi:8-oxo-dGTP pyrophosphatase MutT (NUDIX family)